MYNALVFGNAISQVVKHLPNPLRHDVNASNELSSTRRMLTTKIEKASNKTKSSWLDPQRWQEFSSKEWLFNPDIFEKINCLLIK